MGADRVENNNVYLPKLINSLKTHPRPQKRKEVAWLLGEIIESLRSDPDIYVRAAAAEALGKIGSKKAIPILEQASVFDMVPVRKSALEALERISNDTGKGNRSNDRERMTAD
ncbi:PBS lyase HEAT-like repeat protein [Candidatus Methanoperedens nitroreducens]|uniref:PBS lyase HEAT-like repeat protein n=1 Tax=Candidatus Methanoperedens nitratireducens TaxID=1392998 RepID=A0A062V591_9EURY|nr:HEAT repeat domain-containing protein [Candidatus Methanoperedens nitroreducens]KCZ70939.1 PBS lyase HEAT-like repeat protein [Candidatus Methanoperedens nitroreducens]MDJ1421694.1 HEAT repeat domain-containing protein [Candidatus Methanoperedens sp.]